MKVKFNKVKNRDTQVQAAQQRPGNNNFRKPKELRKMYENPNTFLRESLEVIEIAVQDQLETMFNDYAEWRRGKKKRPEYIFNMCQDIAFVSILPKIVRQNHDFILENGEYFSEIISSAVSELTRRRLAKSKEMISIYSNIYEDLNDIRIEKVVKMGLKGIEWDDALKLCIVSHGSPKHTMINALRMMYGTLKFKDYDSIRKLLSKLYGKREMGKVAVYILLEKSPDSQKGSWVDKELFKVFTDIAIDEIKSKPKDEIKLLLKEYCNERRRTEFEMSTQRRINFTTLNNEDYGKIYRVAKKLSKKNEMYKTFLDFVKKLPSKYMKSNPKIR
jgi:hypothetical protein